MKNHPFKKLKKPVASFCCLFSYFNHSSTNSSTIKTKQNKTEAFQSTSIYDQSHIMVDENNFLKLNTFCNFQWTQNQEKTLNSTQENSIFQFRTMTIKTLTFTCLTKTKPHHKSFKNLN